MTDRIVGFIALAVLIGFLGILVLKLMRVDISIIVAITLALAGWDFLRPAKK